MENKTEELKKEIERCENVKDGDEHFSKINWNIRVSFCRGELKGRQEREQEILKLVKTSEEFLESKKLIELQLKFLKDINNKCTDYSLVSLRSLIRIHINKYVEELKKHITEEV